MWGGGGGGDYMHWTTSGSSSLQMFHIEQHWVGSTFQHVAFDR